MMVSRLSRVIMMDTSVNIHFNASAKLTTLFTAFIFPHLSSQLHYFYPTRPLADFITLPDQEQDWYLVAIISTNPLSLYV